MILASALLLALASLLVVFKAPALPLWYAAILAAEAGHFAAVACALLGVLYYRKKRHAMAVILGAAAFLYLTPLLRAFAISRRLPQNMEAALWPGYTFDPAEMNSPALLSWVAVPGVKTTTRVYATRAGRELSMDIYQRPSNRAQPGVVVVHGGSWRSGVRTELGGLNRYLAGRGFTVVSIDYRLAPEALFPAQRDDVLAAIDYLKTHAAEIGLDSKRLALLGRSAGGQLALAAAYAAQDPAIKGVVAFYAPSDLVWGYAHPTNPLVLDSCRVLEDFLGGKPAGREKLYEQASPVFQVHPNVPPTLMIHGRLDVLVSPHHNERLSSRLRQAGRPHFYLELPWATHGCDAFFSGPCGQLSAYAAERFLTVFLK